MHIENAVPAYWDPILDRPEPIYEAISRYVVHFFDGYLKKDQNALTSLNKVSTVGDLPVVFAGYQRKEGLPPPPLKDGLVHLIINDGMARAIESYRKSIELDPDNQNAKAELMRLME